MTHPISTATAYLVGLDLGERADYTAVAALRQHAVPTGRSRRVRVEFNLDRGNVYESMPETEYQYDVVYLDRWRGRGYKIAVPIMERLLDELHQDTHRQRMDARILNEPALPVWTLVDSTGVGLPVLEDLRAAGLDCTGITITAGESSRQSGQDYYVPKSALVSTLKVLVENRRIDVPDALTLAPVLQAELQNFRRKKKLGTGNDTFGAGESAEWREGAHDDVVLATAMAAWFGETQDPIGEYASTAAIIDAWSAELSHLG